MSIRVRVITVALILLFSATIVCAMSRSHLLAEAPEKNTAEDFNNSACNYGCYNSYGGCAGYPGGSGPSGGYPGGGGGSDGGYGGYPGGNGGFPGEGGSIGEGYGGGRGSSNGGGYRGGGGYVPDAISGRYIGKGVETGGSTHLGETSDSKAQVVLAGGRGGRI